MSVLLAPAATSRRLAHVLASLLFVAAFPVTAGAGEASPPRGSGEPVEVAVGFFVIDVARIDDGAQSVRVDAYLSARWLDERLADPTSRQPRLMPLAEVWHPHLGLANQRDVKLLLPQEVEVEPDGKVVYRQRVSGELSAALDLRDFPFDEQVLAIRVVSLRYGSDAVSLVVDVSHTGRLDHFTVAGWAVDLGKASADEVDLPALGRRISQVELPLLARRQVAYYRWTMLVPLVLIVLMAWSVFWIDPSMVPTQIGVSTASVFALIAFRISTRDLLPPVHYMTRGDFFVLGCTLLVFSTLGQAVLTGKLAGSGREPTARSVDLWSRWIYLAALALVWWMTVP